MSKRHHVTDNKHTALASHKQSKSLADQSENLLIDQVINSSNHIITAISDNAELRSSNSREVDEFISGTSTVNQKEQLTHILSNRDSNPKNMIHDFNSCTRRQLTEKYSHKQIVQFYLEEEKDLDQKDEDGFALLHILAAAGEYKLIRHVSCKVPNINIQNNEGYTPLHLAIANKHYNTVDTLISMGVDCNCKNCYNQTPLHIAVITGDITMALLYHNMYYQI